MSVVDGRRAVGGLGQHGICAAVAAGKDTMADIYAAMTGRMSRAVLERTVRNLCTTGRLREENGRYALTQAGRDILGVRGPAFEMAPYVPPKAPPRRPGSEVCSTLPSMAAGRLWERRK